MTKHTQGPWRYRPRQDGLPGLAVYPAHDFDRPVALTARNGRNPNEEQANAHLIAAAPDMLAALEIALAYDERRQRLSNGNPPTKGQWEALIKAAREAVEKATREPVPS